MYESVCGDDRLDIIERAKKDMLDKTNIASSEDEMKALDGILFRCWQMGWLEKYGEEEKEDIAQRYNDLVEAAEKAVGCELDWTRKTGSVTIRRFVAYRLTKDGYSPSDIARAMGVNHSTVHHYVRMMEDEFDFPSVFRNDIAMYQRFSELVNDLEQVRQ